MIKTFNIFAFLLVFTLGFLTPNAHAQKGSMMDPNDDQAEITGEDHTESVTAVLQDILNQQNVSNVQELDLAKVSDDKWERLGDAVMEVQHLGQAHEVMDQMMGGEGSESLKQIHINMGKAYLGYGGNYGSGMMNNWSNNSFQKGGRFSMMGFGSMMGYGSNSGVYGVLGGLTWIALITFLVAGAYFFIKQAGKK